MTVSMVTVEAVYCRTVGVLKRQRGQKIMNVANAMHGLYILQKGDI